MIQNQDFREFFASLNDNGVRYLVVGGYAVALHGYPRYTKDIDVWIDRSGDNATRIVRALHDFGFGALGLSETDFLQADQIVQLGYAPNRIDILTTIPGVEFSECYKTRVELKDEHLTIPFIDLENLKKNKQASGRAQDVADLENLQS